MPRRAIIAAALCALAAAAPADAGAAVKRLRPLDFGDWRAGQDTRRTPTNIANAGTGFASFFSPLTLPVGSKITAVRFYTTDDGAGRLRNVYVQRCGTTPACTSFASGSESAPQGGDTPLATDIDLSAVNPEALRIQSGYRYQVEVEGAIRGYVWGVDVTYTPPR